MTEPRQLLVREIQLAYILGFTDVEPFRRAVKSGEVPKPNEYIAGKPVWYIADLERRYGTGLVAQNGSVEVDVLQAMDNF